MTKSQQMALAHHCRLAAEVLNPQFRWIRLKSTPPHSLILTVNSGYE